MAGYSPNPLAKKLGISPGSHVFLIDAPPHYLELLASHPEASHSEAPPLEASHSEAPLPDLVAFDTTLTHTTDVVHAFCRTRVQLEQALTDILPGLRANAAVWISWPKKASRVPTDITEDTIRAIALPMGLVDIKVCAVDEVWSGLKLVIRKENRRK